MVNECPELIYGQYNYAPPIHFAVREGHPDLVKYLLDNGAHDPEYKIYPFSDSLVTIAQDRGLTEIVALLEEYNRQPALCKFKGDNGEINYNWTESQTEFQTAVSKNDLDKVKGILISHPEFARDENYFWGEGILTMPAKKGHFEMVELLMSYGAKVPDVLKWTQFYYFERYENAEFMIQKGMNPNVMSWHHVTLLHDMAQKGDIRKAELLIKHGAEIDPIEEQYQSTPLGMAARWGHTAMVEYLLSKKADPNKAGTRWSTPMTWVQKNGMHDIEKMLRNSGAN
ncbi:MAG TPA: ankyrin repeat domain-containing protein [Chitinophagaceae bacterium]|nr:ankyrin repeat domain-containing protein [Chitinophagaceae bacterium]